MTRCKTVCGLFKKIVKEQCIDLSGETSVIIDIKDWKYYMNEAKYIDKYNKRKQNE